MTIKTALLIAGGALALAIPAAASAQGYDPNQAGSYYYIPERPAPAYAPPVYAPPAYAPAYYGPSPRELRWEERRERRRWERLRRLEWERRHGYGYPPPAYGWR